VDREEVRDDNSHYQDGGVFDGSDRGIDDDDDDDNFDYEELLRHVEPQVGPKRSFVLFEIFCDPAGFGHFCSTASTPFVVIKLEHLKVYGNYFD
jgi:hypothetical protein